jgi:hypothetical protein
MWYVRQHIAVIDRETSEKKHWQYSRMTSDTTTNYLTIKPQRKYRNNPTRNSRKMSWYFTVRRPTKCGENSPWNIPQNNERRQSGTHNKVQLCEGWVLFMWLFLQVLSYGPLLNTPRQRSGIEQDLKVLRSLRITDPNKVGATKHVLSLHQTSTLNSCRALAVFVVGQ